MPFEAGGGEEVHHVADVGTLGHRHIEKQHRVVPRADEDEHGELAGELQAVPGEGETQAGAVVGRGERDGGQQPGRGVHVPLKPAEVERVSERAGGRRPQAGGEVVHAADPGPGSPT